MSRAAGGWEDGESRQPGWAQSGGGVSGRRRAGQRGSRVRSDVGEPGRAPRLFGQSLQLGEPLSRRLLPLHSLLFSSPPVFPRLFFPPSPVPVFLSPCFLVFLFLPALGKSSPSSFSFFFFSIFCLSTPPFLFLFFPSPFLLSSLPAAHPSISLSCLTPPSAPSIHHRGLGKCARERGSTQRQESPKFP